MTNLSHPALEEGYLLSGELGEEQLANRRLLRSGMRQAGFFGINTEWWHFDCGDRELVRRSFRRVL